MRLTLRTMLAYLDDILEPEDQAAIGKRVEESPRASELAHRVRDVMRRLRLGAPQLSGKGMGLDANTVAEYLDNTMPPERVTDFEKVCLESDVHLAEVGACHQILTLVLGEPADVDPASRQQMYRAPQLAAGLADQQATAGETAGTGQPEGQIEPVAVTGGNGSAEGETAEPETAEASGGALSAAEEGGKKKRRKKPEVPEYLRDSGGKQYKSEVPEYLRQARRSRRRRTLIGVLAAVLLVGAGFFLANRFGVVDRMFPVETAEHIPEEAQRFTPPEVDEGTSVSPELPEGATPSKVDPEAGGGEAPPFDPTKQAGGDAPPFEPGDDVTVPPLPEDPKVKLPAGKKPDEAAKIPLKQPEQGLPGGKTAPAPVPKAKEKSGETAKPSEVAIAEKKTLPPPPPKKSPEGKEPPATTEGEQAGLYVSPVGVLLRYDPDKGQWWRLPSRSVLNSGDRLLALPTYRPTINLSGGVTMQMIGGTAVELHRAQADDTPVIELLYGRVVLTGGLGQGSNRLTLNAGQQEHLFTLDEADSTLAVELTQEHIPGANPEKEGSAEIVLDFYAASGGMRWEHGQRGTDVRAPVHWRPDGRVVKPEEGMDPLPEWIYSDMPSGGDRLASIALEEAITLDRPAELSLMELVGRRRSEVRSLSARSSVYVGQFGPFVKALNDPDQRATWSLHIETLRRAMDLSPTVAGKIREAFTRTAGPENGKALYRMLWGYSNEDLKSGADEQLVKYLEHDSLAFRVMAFWNLKRITGLGMNYGPEYPAPNRARSVLRWKKLLADGEIRLPTPEAERSDPTEPEAAAPAKEDRLP